MHPGKNYSEEQAEGHKDNDQNFKTWSCTKPTKCKLEEARQNEREALLNSIGSEADNPEILEAQSVDSGGIVFLPLLSSTRRNQPDILEVSIVNSGKVTSLPPENPPSAAERKLEDVVPRLEATIDYQFSELQHGWHALHGCLWDHPRGNRRLALLGDSLLRTELIKRWLLTDERLSTFPRYILASPHTNFGRVLCFYPG
jgi:hypothetical protein